MNYLIVVDMQNDFVTGVLGSEPARKIVPAIKKKIQEYQSNKGMIVFTRDTHGEDYLDTTEGKYLPVKHCILGTEGHKIVPELLEGLHTTNFHFINKPNFGWKHWDSWGILPEDTIELCGVCTDICVISNALLLKTAFPDTKIIINGNLCAGTTLDKHLDALEVAKSCQIEVKYD